MHRTSLLIAALASSVHSVAQAQRDGSIVGQWTSDTYVAGDAGMMMLNFFPNGTYARKSVVMTEFGWTLAGSTLLIAPVIETKGPDVKYGKASEIQLVFNGDTLFATAGGQLLILTRISGPVGQGLLLGRWQSAADQSETIVQDFRADGKLVVYVTQSREAGRYAIYDERINFQQQIPLPARKRWRFKLSGDKLVVYMSDKLPPLELRKTDDQLATQGRSQ